MWFLNIPISTVYINALVLYNGKSLPNFVIRTLLGTDLLWLKNKHYFQLVYALNGVCGFKYNCSNVIHSNVIHKIMFPLFFSANNFL